MNKSKDSKLPSEVVSETPEKCWVCHKLTTEHYYGIFIHDECREKHYPNIMALFNEVDMELDSL